MGGGAHHRPQAGRGQAVGDEHNPGGADVGVRTAGSASSGSDSASSPTVGQRGLVRCLGGSRIRLGLAAAKKAWVTGRGRVYRPLSPGNLVGVVPLPGGVDKSLPRIAALMLLMNALITSWCSSSP